MPADAQTAERKRVLITGANGYIAGRMLTELSERHDLTLLDVSMPSAEALGLPADGVRCVAADLVGGPPASYADAFDVDVVVHCGHIWARDGASLAERFDVEQRNIRMASVVYEQAAESGREAPRVVVAGSNHAADYYEPLILRGEWEHVDPDLVPRSDNFYGWSKAVIELLGFLWACGRESSTVVETVNIRIGAPRETDVASCPDGDLVCVRRGLAAYVSARDQADLFARAIDVADVRDRHGVPFQIVYGISGNANRYWSLASARTVLGYEPSDDSQTRFLSDFSRHLAAARAGASQGGAA